MHFEIHDVIRCSWCHHTIRIGSHVCVYTLSIQNRSEADRHTTCIRFVTIKITHSTFPLLKSGFRIILCLCSTWYAFSKCEKKFPIETTLYFSPKELNALQSISSSEKCVSIFVSCKCHRNRLTWHESWR